MKIAIYQINPDRDENNVAFLNYENLERFQGSAALRSEIYDKVFEGEVECGTLEEVYQMFNLDHPDRYRGRSLSVSDVVEVVGEEKPTFHFCDSIGFREVDFDPDMTEPLKEKKIKVVLCEPGKVARVAEIRTELSDLQKVVGGLIEPYYPFEEQVCIVCNDEGKYNGMRPCRAIYGEDREMMDIIINKCVEALNRIRAGIQLLVEDAVAFDAFCFMNRAMILQRNIMNFSKKHGAGVECSFKDFVDPRKPENNFGWRPFQIAFILMNLKAIVDPAGKEREIVDLLYFPTGGGKTEAYLGLMAFVIANRRLRSKDTDEYNRDGGVTAILRYTLRLLTTQQRDRITKMVLAAEMIRAREYPKYGKEPISIGFWVGGGVTPNTFEELKEDPEDPQKTRNARSKKNLIYKQLLTCPFCGKPLKDENFYIDIPTKSVNIYCSDKMCMFYRYKQGNKMKIPVYLVDEEIYAKCPTIILSTVDKFARLPWDVNTNTIFGRVDRLCSRDGYVAIGAEHSRHNRTEELPTSILTPIKPFLPPELIIQDELHLITGPLGTIYGAYETIIEDLCTYSAAGKTIKPKYVVSTATIKNAAEQAKCLYGRKETAQFPPNGFEIGDSFFIREIPVENDPFRRYVGICAPGQSVKTALLRVYAIILQAAYNLSQEEECKDYIDPYYTLVGYYNSIRELGGAVRLLQDDIPDRIQRIKKKYGT